DRRERDPLRRRSGARGVPAPARPPAPPATAPHQLPGERVGAAPPRRPPDPVPLRVGLAATRDPPRRPGRVRPARRPHLRSTFDVLRRSHREPRVLRRPLLLPPALHG